MTEAPTRCYVRGCATMKPAHLLMCEACWRLVPIGRQVQVYQANILRKHNQPGARELYVKIIHAARSDVAKARGSTGGVRQ